MGRFTVKTDIAREVLSELLGTFILVLINIGGPLNLILSGTKDSFLACVCCGVGVLMGMVTSMSNSGAHINPMVTTSFAARGMFPWKKVPYFLAAQYIGAFLAAALAYANFADAIHVFDGGVRAFNGVNGTGIAFASSPADGVSFFTATLDTILCSALLMFAICAITDKYNSGVPVYLYAPFVSTVVMGLCASFSYNCSSIMNPARDLGPRVFTLLAGYGFHGFQFHKGLFWVMAFAMPHVGGFLGSQLYWFSIGLQKPGEEDRTTISEDPQLMKSVS